MGILQQQQASILISVLMLVLAPAKGRVVEELASGSVCYTNDTLQSPNGVFEFGLVSPGASKFLYLGIWYSGIKPTTIVWVANRNNPIDGGEGSFFTLDLGGELSVRNWDAQVLWSSGTPYSNVTRAVLLDTGNLVLETVLKDQVWQSFEHPGNTWLPYMKMGLGMQLTSWASSEDPSEGPFSLRMLNTTEFVCLWKDQRQYWSSGPWEENGFRAIPEMTTATFYNFTFQNNAFTWNPYNGTNFVSHFMMDSAGDMTQVSLLSSSGGWAPFWVEPNVLCNVYALCGSFGICDTSTSQPCSCPLGFSPTNPTGWDSKVWYYGCQPKTPLHCITDEFAKINGTAFDSNSLSFSSPAMNSSACMYACKNNCSCLGFYYDPTTLNCSLFYDELHDGKVSSDIGGDFYLRVPRGTNKVPVGTKQTNYKLIVGISIAISTTIFFLLLVGFAIVVRKRRRKTRRESFPPLAFPGLLTMFSYRELQTATKNFTESLGSGGFGFVFKGSLHDGTELGVKKLNWLRQGEKQFRTEVSTIGTIQHLNLVCLIGFTCEGKHRLLAYEYMPNGSLDRWLFHKKETIDWASRYHIALGTARGISYLHEECRHKIIHCDIKPENILLDAKFNAKVSDFGLAKILGKEFSRVMTTLRGTRGYLAPEWLAGSPLTSKADVYSYGMTLLEIISGRRNLVPPKENEKLNDRDGKNKYIFFPIWAIEQMIKDNFLSLVDDRIQDGVDIEQLRKVAYVAGWCIQDEEELRPSMKNVVDMLEGSIDVNGPPPIPSSLKLLASINDEED